MKNNRRFFGWVLAAFAAIFVAPTPAPADFEFADIACETSETSGTGTLNLAGALVGGYLGFAAAGIESGDTVPYNIRNGSQLETGIGTFTDATPDTLSRTAFLSTDGSGNELTLSGTSTVCIGPGAQIWTGGASWAMSIGTSGAFTTGTIDLGHASDTTIARGSAGHPTAEGVSLDLAGVQSIWIPAGAMTPRITSGCAADRRETNGITFDFVGCDTAADEAVQFHVAFPKSWDAGTLTFGVIWTAASGTGTVDWELSCGSFANDVAINSTGLGTAVAVNDTLIAANDVHLTAVSGALTVANASDTALTWCQLLRDVSDDTLGVDAQAIGLNLYYTTDLANDD